MSECVQQSSPGSSTSSGVFERWEEFLAHESHFNTSSGPNAHLASSSLFLPRPFPVQRRKRKRNIGAQGLPGSLNDLQRFSQTPTSLVSTRRGTVRIQNTANLAKNKKHTTVRPLSAAGLLCKGPAGCQSHRGLSG